MTKTEILNKYRARRDAYIKHIEESKEYPGSILSLNEEEITILNNMVFEIKEFITDLESMQPIDTAVTDDDLSPKDVHTEHCCADHGCKYLDPECTVASGEKKQSFSCDLCLYDNFYWQGGE